MTNKVWPSLPLLLAGLELPPSLGGMQDNLSTCLLAVVLSELGWPGQVVWRNACTKGPCGETLGFALLAWDGQQCNAYGQTFEQLLGMSSGPFRDFAGPGKIYPAAECLVPAVLEDSAQELASMRASVLRAFAPAPASIRTAPRL